MVPEEGWGCIVCIPSFHSQILLYKGISTGKGEYSSGCFNPRVGSKSYYVADINYALILYLFKNDVHLHVYEIVVDGNTLARIHVDWK